MKVNGITVDDTFAEAFGMSATGVIITADSARWARQAAVTMSGFGTSVIGAGAEVGIDRELKPEETPDGRPDVRVLLFGFSPDAVKPQLKNRVGQCVLTSPGSACYSDGEGAWRPALLAGAGHGWRVRHRGDDGHRHRRGRRRQPIDLGQRPRRPAYDGGSRGRRHRRRA
jgi:formylmethanofuran--tetrahydromethanopterin N-formyltransferase